MRRFFRLFWRDRERDLDAELHAYLDALVEEKTRAGMTPEEALRAARIELGGMEQVKELVRETRTGAFVGGLAQDLRYAFRTLLRSPGFLLVTVLTLALGIGANTALFSVVNVLLLRPLPYKDAGRLVYVSEFWPHELPVRSPVSPDFDNWKTKSHLIERIEAYGGGFPGILTGAGEPEHIEGTRVTAGFLDLIGTRMVLGRSFTAEEDSPNGPPAAILGNALWRNRFGASEEIVGKTIVIDRRSYTVVGVLPAGFVFPDNNLSPRLLLPMSLPLNPNWHDEKNFRLVRVLARLKPGVTPEALRAEFAAILRGTASEEPPQFATMRKDMQVLTTPLRQWLSGDIRPFLLILEAAVVMVLLIGCLNVANLQIARSIAREKEMALRAALGAGRTRLTRQLVTESLLLSSVGGAAGLMLGYAGLNYLRFALPPNLHLLETVRVDYAVLGFTLVVAILTGVFTGLAPAWAAFGAELSGTMNRGGGRATAGGHHRLRGALVIAEVALAMVLVVASGLLIRSFWHLASVDLGFDPHNVLTLRIPIYEGERAPESYAAELLERARAIPGVRDAAIGGGLPVIGSDGTAGIVAEGQPPPPPGGAPSLPVTGVNSTYFNVLGIPLTRGRGFTDADREGAPLVVIVNQSFASRFFPGADAIGKHVKFGSVGERPWFEIVGIAGDVRQNGLLSADSTDVYVPYRQRQTLGPDFMLILKTESRSSAVATDATRAIHAVAPNLAIFDIATMEDRISGALTAQRASMISMGIFAALALTLACIGIFGVISYFVSRRTHEFGIRMALGAQPREVLKLVLRSGLLMTCAGIAIGLAGSLALTKVLGTLLYEIKTTDLVTLSSAAMLFIAVALAACYIPARWAARVDPIVTLRHE